MIDYQRQKVITVQGLVLRIPTPGSGCLVCLAILVEEGKKDQCGHREYLPRIKQGGLLSSTSSFLTTLLNWSHASGLIQNINRLACAC